ncbi:MAG TPA: sigma-70 family RNA polymerase sigma factor [Thermoleophilaceae bacterium]|jgi:RNA polymerase sigma-70 factor (ECF subfamily)
MQDAISNRPARHPLAEAFERHAESVRRTAYSVVRDSDLADDVTQEVFLALWVRPDRFDPERGTFVSLLRVMARSRALDAARHSRAGERAHDRLRNEAAAAADPDPAELVVSASRARELRGAVARLPLEQREAIGLAYWGELTADQVATVHGVPHGTAKSRIRIGLAKLRRDFDH